MTYKQIINSSLTNIGLGLLLAFILASWLPPKCSLINKYIVGCPNKERISQETPEQKELSRYPYSKIDRANIDFAVDAQDYRKESAIRFAVRDEKDTNGTIPPYIMTLKYKTQDSFQPINLIYHPLLNSLDWPVISNSDDRLYQNPNHITYPQDTEWQVIVGDFSKLTKNGNRFAADQSAANRYNLSASQYIPLETLNTLENIDYILTSYKPLYRDNSWLLFDRDFDLSLADTTNNQLQFMIDIANFDSQKPILLSQVHIDYRKMAP